jgi:CTP synthase
MMEDQRTIGERGGTMRLGAWPCALAPESLARQAYGADSVDERHRHRYEFNNAYRQAFERRGLVATGTCPRGNLVEIIEVPDHPWFLAVQFHPEFKSKPTRAHPLFRDFLAAALHRREGARAELEVR